MGEVAAASMANTGAILLVQRTYLDFYGFWPHQADNPFTEVLNRTQKFVASTTLEEPPCKREGTDGDIKLYGRAVAIDDLDLRTTYRAAIKARINWEPLEGTYHLFALDLQAGGYVRFEGTEKEIWTWDPTRGLRKDRRPALEGGQ